MKKRALFSLLAASAALAVSGGFAGTVQAQSSGAAFNAEEYFAGKTIEVIINADAGGGLDTTTRFLLQGFGEQIPGKPTIVATNIAEIPGIAAVYDAPASGDRITIGVTSRVSSLYTTTLDVAATHDPKQMQIAGGYGGNPGMTVIFNDAAETYDSIADASGVDSPELVTAGKVGDASSLIGHPFYVSWLCDTFDLPCRMVSVADDSMNQLAQDVERGQINMIDSLGTTLIRVMADDLMSGKAKVLGEYAEEGASELVSPYPRPNIRELLPNAAAGAELDALMPVMSFGGVGNAIFTGPEVPAEAVRIIADAFVAKASTPEDLLQYTRGRFGEYPGHSFTPSVIGGDDAQRIYQAGMDQFFANQEFYKELQNRLYAKYWE